MLRIALYSHDTYGLGHLRRSLKIASAISSRLSGIAGLLITGSRWSRLFPLPRGFRRVELPPVVKVGAGDYRSAVPGEDLNAVVATRRNRILDAVTHFRPDLMLVDNVPCGLHGETLPALRWLRKRTRAKVILVLRDVLDRPSVAREEWRRAGAGAAIQEVFDEIWLFGDLEDATRLIADGPLGSAAGKVLACGRIGEPRRILDLSPAGARELPPRVLVSCGGGGDAAPLVETYLQALDCFRPKVTSQVVLGPDYPLHRRRAAALAAGPRTEVRGFVPDLAAWLGAADVVVAMAGYNTVCEVLASGRPAVLVPRVRPREEQLLRARRWASAGRAKLVHPDFLSPETLWKAVEELLASGPLEPLALVGGRVAARRAAELLGVPVEAAEAAA